MIITNGVNQLQMQPKDQPQQLIQVGDNALDLPNLLVGERVVAHVLAELPNGRFSARVKDSIIDLNLPRNTEPGEELDLTVLRQDPRLTFVPTPRPALLELAAPLPNPPNVRLSSTAQMLSQLQVQQENADPVKERAARSVVVQGVMPLSAGLPDDKLPGQLQNALSKSGLFYESHQAEWVSGQRSLQSLFDEPQARNAASPATLLAVAKAPPLPQTPAPTAPATSPMAVMAETPVQNSSRTPELATPATVAAPASADQLPLTAATDEPPAAEKSAPAAASPAALASTPAAPAPTPTVQQQLNVLDTRQLAWQGQVWPGQTMQWQVEEEVKERDVTGEIKTSVWHTRIRLELPQLGEVEARLSLTPQGVSIRFATGNAGTGDAIRQHTAKLNQGFAAAGLTLASAKVETHGNE
jgi:hypothetical protein